MSNIKILSIIFIIIGNVLLGGCNLYKGINHNLNNNEKFNQEELSIFEYNGQFMNSYKKYIEPLYIEEYHNAKKFLKDQGSISNEGYIEEYKKLLEVSGRNISGFKKEMNNLVTQDIELTDLNNKLVKNSDDLITEINTKTNEIKNIPKEKYSLETEKFINYIELNFQISETIINKFANSIKNIRHYLDIELNI